MIIPDLYIYWQSNLVDCACQ